MEVLVKSGRPRQVFSREYMIIYLNNMCKTFKMI